MYTTMKKVSDDVFGCYWEVLMRLILCSHGENYCDNCIQCGSRVTKLHFLRC